MLGSACLALAVPGEAKAACLNPITGNNCSKFDSATGNSFSFDVFSSSFSNATSGGTGAVQVIFDGESAGRTFNYTGVTLTLGKTGSPDQIINIPNSSFAGNGTSARSFFGAPTGVNFFGVTSAVLSGVFSTTSPTTSPSTIFEAGIRFNSNGAATDGVLDSGGFSAPSGEVTQVSIYAGAQPTVPGPLPVLGAGMAFGFSRKLRKRISAV
jgi:hypothetical protein